MDSEQKLKHLILLKHQEWNPEFLAGVEITAANIDEVYDESSEDGKLQDAKSEMRCSGIETELATEYLRNYESTAVAAQYIDGSWVGWTYWYGGGKHGEPEEIDWMEESYPVTCKEEEKFVIVRTFETVPE